MQLLKDIENIVLEAGKIVLSANHIKEKTTLKTSDADMVTAYDVKVEEFLKTKLLNLVKNAIFYGEEEKENVSPNIGYAFIVDPIDGTANFVRGLRQSAISVALAKDGVIEYAVVYDPYKDELFSAKLNGGAYLNHQEIHVSNTVLSKGIFAFGTTPYNKSLHQKTISILSQLFDRACDFRRMGAAALDLCALACGRYELFFECELSPWDYAAASLIITEAGGRITTLDKNKICFDHKISIWASNAVNYNILDEIIIK